MSIVLVSLCTVQSVEHQLSQALAVHVRDFLEQIILNSEEGFPVLIFEQLLQNVYTEQIINNTFFFLFYLSNEISTSFHFLATKFQFCAVLM